MKNFKKLGYISLFVCIALLIQLFSGVSFATVQVLALEELDDLTLYGRLSQEDLQDIGHVRVTDRFMSEMNMIEYENGDGTYTTYLFSQPIKYLDVATNTVRYIRDETNVEVFRSAVGAFLVDAEPTSYTDIEDVVVSQSVASTNYSSIPTMIAGRTAQTGADYQIYVKFDLSSIQNTIQYNQVISACFAMYQTASYTMNQSFSLGCYQILEDWDSETVTWNTKPIYDENHLMAESIYQETPNGVNSEDLRNKYHYFMITNLAQGWLQGIPNYGLAFEEIYGTVGSRSFATVENSNQNRRPFFRITYTTDTGNSTNVGIKAGSKYFIKQNGLYLTANGSTLTKSTFTGATSQQWQVVDNGDGYYYLVPVSNSNLGLTYTSTSINLGARGSTAAFHFKFIRNWNGTYHIATKSHPTKGLGSPSPMGTTLSLRTLTTTIANYDDWSLEAIGENKAYWVMSEGIAAYPEDNEWVYDYTVYSMSDYCNWNYQIVEGAATTTAARLLISSNFCALHAHGTCGGLDYSVEGGGGFRFLSANSVVRPDNAFSYGISSFADNALAATRVVLLAACSAGNDATTNGESTTASTQEVYNMASEIYRKGAHVVIAFMNPAAANEWYFMFYAMCAAGKTIEEAMIEADRYALSVTDGDFGNALNRHVLGDTSLRMTVYS